MRKNSSPLVVGTTTGAVAAIRATSQNAEINGVPVADCDGQAGRPRLTCRAVVAFTSERPRMPSFTTRPEIRGTFGVVASTHWLVSAVGMSVLEKGGNAFDAAGAAGFTSQVVDPHLNGPLGDAPILVWSAAERRASMICGQGVAPEAATIARFRDLGLPLIPGTGLLAAPVPGAVGAWLRLLEEWGTMPLADILAPAIGYADNGYPASQR